MRAFHGAGFGLLLGVATFVPDFAEAGNADATAALQAIATQHHLGRMWIHEEVAGTPVLDIGINGADANEPKPIGSLSKSITGIGIALLIQDGRLSLNSTVGELLGKVYADHNRAMDKNLRTVTIARLLTHTAGLRPNKLTDPVNGLESESVLRTLGDNPTAFDFLNASDGDHSTGQSSFVYSNMSYLMLGLVLEAVSGQSYEDFCRSRIFGPLQISGASLLGGRYRAISPYSGWVMSRADIGKVWARVFNLDHPSLLSRATLRRTLFAPLGQATGGARYVMGVQIKRSANGSTYRLYHNGIQSTYLVNAWDGGGYSSYLEDTVPGTLWVYTTSPVPPRSEWKAINDDVRKTLETVGGGGS